MDVGAIPDPPALQPWSWPLLTAFRRGDSSALCQESPEGPSVSIGPGATAEPDVVRGQMDEAHQEKEGHGSQTTPLQLSVLPDFLKPPQVREKDLQCDVCGRSFAKTRELKRHSLVHTGERPFLCSFCGRGFTQKGNLKTHYKVHLGHKGRVDYGNVSSIMNKCAFLNSSPGESQLGSLRCEQCGTNCESQSTLQAHRITSHSQKQPTSEPETYFCLHCSFQFSQRQQLEEHMETHNKPKPFSCPDCGKKFMKEDSMVVHRKTHNERTYQCSQCDRAFLTPSLLKAHLTVHSGERPFGCSVCGKGFQSKSNLIRHCQSHLKQRPYICSVCEKSYSRAEALMAHSRLHTGERPYLCGLCGKTFSYRQGLMAHQRIHAGPRMGPTRQLGRPKQQPILDP